MTCLVKIGEIPVGQGLDKIIEIIRKITEDEVIYIKAKGTYKYSLLLKGDDRFL